MKRLEVMGKSFQFTGDNPPQYKSLSFQVQVIRDQYNVVRAEFYIEGQELQNFLDAGMDYDQLAEEKMKWILETNTTPVDAYMLEGIQREQREIAGSVEATKQAAIEAARAEAESKIAEKDEEIAMLQQMIVELTLMLSMIGQQELPAEPDPEPPQEDPDIPPEEGAPDDPEPEAPDDPVADDPDTTPIDEGGQGGE